MSQATKAPLDTGTIGTAGTRGTRPTGTGFTASTGAVTSTATASTRLSTLEARLRHARQVLGVQWAGWLLLGCALVAAVLGWGFGWLELKLITVASLVAFLCAIAFTLGRQTYQVTLRLQSTQVVVGERALGDLIVTNTSDRRLLPARLELPVGRRLASFGLPTLAGKASHEEVFAVPTTRRSVIRIGPARSVRGDPFGLMGREIRWTDAIDLYVHPRTVRIPGRQGGFIRDLEGYTTAELTNSDVSFHALREYVAGDDRRYVHWRSSARTGTLMVRQFEETRRSHVAIGLDLDQHSYESPEEFELAVSVTGSLSLQALRDENNVAVMTTRGRLRALSPKRALDELCMVEAVPDGGVSVLARALKHNEPNASVVSMVTGAVQTPHQIRLATSLYGMDVKVLAVRVNLGAEMTVQTTNNVSVVTLGDLEELPRAVRRASL
ncbi:DUF58 domain-containing protein [Propionibacteriaceae bacterium Y1685]